MKEHLLAYILATILLLFAVFSISETAFDESQPASDTKTLKEEIADHLVKDKKLCMRQPSAWFGWAMPVEVCSNGPPYIIYIIGGIFFLAALGAYKAPSKNNIVSELNKKLAKKGIVEARKTIGIDNNKNYDIFAAINKLEDSYLLILFNGSSKKTNKQYEFKYLKELLTYLEQHTTFRISDFKNA